MQESAFINDNIPHGKNCLQWRFKQTTKTSEERRLDWQSTDSSFESGESASCMQVQKTCSKLDGKILSSRDAMTTSQTNTKQLCSISNINDQGNG